MKALRPRLVFGLACLLLGQAAVITTRAKQGVSYEPLTVGEGLPFEVSGWQRYTVANRNTTSNGCYIAFICNTDCGYCNALASRHGQGIQSDTLGLRPLWLVGGDSARVAAWADGHGLPRENVLGLSAKNAGFWRPAVLGDVWVTPTRVVLTSKLVVRDARPSDALLNAEELQALCRNGGIAPQSIGELIDAAGPGR